MKFRTLGRRVLTGCAIGALCALGISGQSTGTSITPPWSPPPALATGCTNWSSHFTGQYAGGWSYASADSASITINQPLYVCGSGNSYWVMVNGASSTNKVGMGCVEGNQVYAQDGWIVFGNYTPYHFYEVANNASCDQGDITWAQASYGTTHTYETQVGADQYGKRAIFYLDGSQMNSLSTDWYYGSNFQIATETHEQENRTGGESFRSMVGCNLNPGNPIGCNPGTSLSASCGIQQGCLSPTNPYGCYAARTTNGFDVYDSRGNGGTC